MEVLSSIGGSHELTPEWEILTEALVLSFMEVDDHPAVAKLLTLTEWGKGALESLHETCLANLAREPRDPILKRAAILVEAALEVRPRRPLPTPTP